MSLNRRYIETLGAKLNLTPARSEGPDVTRPPLTQHSINMPSNGCVSQSGLAHEPRYLKVVQELEAQRTQLTEPLKLPSEQQIAVDQKISRDTVRRAMTLLAERGAVTRRRGRGTYLRPLYSRPARTRGNVIGFIPPWWAKADNTWSPETTSVFDGVSQFAEQNGCQTSTLYVERHEDDEHKLLAKLQAENLSGLLWMNPVPEQGLLLEAVARHVPCMVVGREYRDIAPLHAVVPDFRQAARLLDEHLVSMGHSVYSVVGRSPADPYGASWLQATDEAFRRRGAYFDHQAYYLNITPFDRDRMAELMMDFHLAQQPDSHALVLTSSSYLVPLLASARFRDAVPRQYSLVAFDYGCQPMNTYWPGKPVTHVTCNWSELGRKALEGLFALMQGQDAPDVICEPVTLVEGQTVTGTHRHAWRISPSGRHTV